MGTCSCPFKGLKFFGILSEKKGCSVVFTQAPTLVFGGVPPQKKREKKSPSPRDMPRVMKFLKIKFEMVKPCLLN